MATKKTSRSDRFYEMLQKLFHEIDQDAIMAEVKALKAAKPGLSRKQLALIMTRKAATKTATIGAAVGGSTGPLAIIALAPDILNLVRQQSRLILSIAFLYGQKPDLRERFREVLLTLRISTVASAAKKGSRVLIDRAFEKQTAKGMARLFGRRIVARKIPAMVPVAGIFIGAALNYFAVRTTGHTAIKYYSKLLREKQAETRKRRAQRGTKSRKMKPLPRNAKRKSQRGKPT